MPAATELPIADRVQAWRRERQLKELRPLGIRFFMSQFRHQMQEADAENAVQTVLFRLERAVQEDRAPDDMAAAFYRGVKRAGLDELKRRGRAGEVELDVVEGASSVELTPAERVESREDAARLQEALQLMHRPYREAIVMRWGLGMTRAEIAEAKKISTGVVRDRLKRGAAQIKDQLMAVTSGFYCKEMQDFVSSSLFEEWASGTGNPEDMERVEKHLAHCGICRGFHARLMHQLHEAASGAIVLGGVAAHFAGRSGIRDHLSSWISGAHQHAQGAAGQVRLATLKATGVLPGSSTDGATAAGGAGGLGVAAKAAVVLCAGAAAGGTCAATGIVAIPVVGGATSSSTSTQTTPTTTTSTPIAAPAASTADSAASSVAATTPPPETPAQRKQREFGFEQSASTPSSSASSGGGTTEFGSAPSAGSSSSSGGGGATKSSGFGFEK